MNAKFNKEEINILAAATTADYDITFKMFVAFGTSPIAGVEGGLGIGYVTKFKDYSAIAAIQKKIPNFPHSYMYFFFNQTNSFSRQQGYL